MRLVAMGSVVIALGCVMGCAAGVGEPGEGELSTAEGAMSRVPSTTKVSSSAPGSAQSLAKKGSLAQQAPVSPTAFGTSITTQCWDLSQGPKNNDLGDVCVTNDGDSIDVTYTTNGACLLTQVHVCAATTDFPWSPPGQCAYKAEFNDSPTSSYTVSVPLSDFPAAVCDETVFFLQAHAALDCTASGGGQESAYAGAFKGNVAYTLQCPPPPEEGCTLTQGYWKNHPEDWGLSGVELGGVQYSQPDALAILHTPTGGDASLILSHQLIAAKLNINVGGASSSSVDATVAAADAWLAANADADGLLPFGVPSASAAGADGVALSAILDDYNNGLIGPGHCE